MNERDTLRRRRNSRHLSYPPWAVWAVLLVGATVASCSSAEIGDPNMLDIDAGGASETSEVGTIDGGMGDEADTGAGPDVGVGAEVGSGADVELGADAPPRIGACVDDSDCVAGQYCLVDTCADDVCPQGARFCVESDRYVCNDDGSLLSLVETCSDGCQDGVCQQACQPACAGRTCGGDGCGGSCGTCGAGQNCTDHRCATPDVDEPNGNQGSWSQDVAVAIPLPLNTTHMGVISFVGDQDFYSISLQGAGTLHVEVTNAPASSSPVDYSYQLTCPLQSDYGTATSPSGEGATTTLEHDFNCWYDAPFTYILRIHDNGDDEQDSEHPYYVTATLF